MCKITIGAGSNYHIVIVLIGCRITRSNKSTKILFRVNSVNDTLLIEQLFL